MASQDLYILPHMQMAEFAVRARSEAILNKSMLPAGPQMGRAAAQQQQKAEAKARL
jgi:hypothetical protein